MVFVLSKIGPGKLPGSAQPPSRLKAHDHTFLEQTTVTAILYPNHPVHFDLSRLPVGSWCNDRPRSEVLSVASKGLTQRAHHSPSSRQSRVAPRSTICST